MPTYDYLCDACGHQFEQFQGINDPLLKTCPACKRRKLRRLLGTGAAIMFKGSGFYQTDYRSDSYQKAAKKDSSSKSADGAGGAKESSGAAKESKSTDTGSKSSSSNKSD
jgi:putative FmdB family regulatory protein